MKTSLIYALLVLAFVLIVASSGVLAEEEELAGLTVPATNGSWVEATSAHEGFIYGRVNMEDGATYEGRLRWGGREEAFWGNYFNGVKDENPWADQVLDEQLTKDQPFELLGLEIGNWERRINLKRPLMTRFGDITRIEAKGRDLWVTLKSGTVVNLDRFAADDFADGLRVWDAIGGTVDLGEWRIRSVEFLPTPALASAPERLHGTVHTPLGQFTGFIQWNRVSSTGLDQLAGKTADGDLSLQFDSIGSIERHSDSSSLVRLRDDRSIVLFGTRDVGEENRGVYVDDQRYGRVLVSWDAFERIDFNKPGSGDFGSGPAYGDFPAGQRLTGTVTIRGGRRLAGRLVYDLDESEVTETFDAPSQGVHYTIPFGLIASISPDGGQERGLEHALVTLHSGEELKLEHADDLGEGNAGLLVFDNDRERPEYTPWSEVERIDFDRPTEMYPPTAS